jgi:hypothetical protein
MINKRTAPVRTDGGDPNILSPFAQWSQNIYVCASTVRARIGTTYNGTGGFENLLLDKTYRSFTGPGEVAPVWALEKPNLNFSEVNSIWGLVDEGYLDSPGLQTIQRDHFYLPASMSLIVGNVSDTVASAVLPGTALFDLYTAGGSNVYTQSLDYTGITNQAILNKWVSLGGSPSGIAEMVNLIFVDTMTQWSVGSKSLLDANQAPPGVMSTLSNVEVLSDKIQYNMLYAIPVCIFLDYNLLEAILILAIWVSIILGALLIGIFKKVTLNTIRQLSNQSMTHLKLI